MAKVLCLFALTAASLAVVAYAASNNAYCNPSLCKLTGGVNTMCKFSPKKTSGECGNIKSFGVTEEEKIELVKIHNKLRAQVRNGLEKRGNPGPQPAATDIGDLTWSDELARGAQAWANQCIWEHDECRNTVTDFVGQNLALQKGYPDYNTNLTAMVLDWYDEVELFDSNQVEKMIDFKGTGHYTQLVWADTTQVGCGVIRFNQDGFWRTSHLACNYAPAGNWIEGRVYTPVK